jgi:hypothetical protein
VTESYLTAADIRGLLVHTSTAQLIHLRRLRLTNNVARSEVRDALVAQQKFFLYLPDDDPRLLVLERMHFADADAWTAAIDRAVPDNGAVPIEGEALLAYLLQALS